LSGYYGMLVSGNGKYLAGGLYFDGNCNLSGSNISGGSGGQYSTTSVTGTYGQNSDGTINLTMNFAGQTTAQTYLVGVSESGIKARGLESDGTVEATIDLQSQLTTLPSGYTTASLSGTYAASCISGGAADLNNVTFDGQGNLTGVDPYDVGGSLGNSPYSGTYSVSSDGTFVGSLVGSYSSYSFNGVIDNGVSEIEYVYDQAGSGAVLGCVGKQASSGTANLSGYYGIVVGGNAQTGGGGKYLSGSVYFDGVGGLTASNLNGGINGTYGNTTATGTYTLNSDNTISITMNLAGQSTPQTYIVGVSEGGKEAAGIETDGSAIATIDIQSQLQLPAKPYNLASLNGTYSASCGGSEVDLNYVIFDGQGNLTGVDAYDDGGFGNSPYTGTYTVNSDGTFAGGFAGSYSVFTMTGVIDNATAEIEYTYDQSGVGGVVSCIGESSYGPIGANPVAATPTFSPAPGAYGSNQSIALSDTTAGATIYYTTNGLAPTTSSAVYSASIPVSATTTVQAIAVASGYNNSAIAAGTYFLTSGLPTAATPTFNPNPGTYSSPQSVTLSDTTPGAIIYYTTNGTTPNTNSSVYSSAISVTTTTTIEAIAVASGYGNSAVASGTYTITLPTAATPTFNPLPGNYSSQQSVTLSDTTPGAVIYYTTNGTTPGTGSSVYSGAIPVSVTTTIEAIAIASGYQNSAVASGTYTISSSGTVVNLASYYNVYGIATIGNAPTHGGFDNDSYDFNSSLIGTSLTYQGLNIPLGAANTADAITSLTVSLPAGQYSQLFLLGAGVNGAQTSQTIVVTYTDGSTSTFTQSFSDWAVPKAYSGETTVLAAPSRIGPNGQTATPAVNVYGYTLSLNSAKTVASIKFPSNRNLVFLGIGLGTPTPTAATPSFNPAPGTYSAAESVSLSDTTKGAVIYYTTNGTTPTTGSAVYSSPITVSATTTIEAIAVASGYNNSAVATGVYTINGTPIVPYIQVNGGSWQQTATATVNAGSTVNLGPQPVSGGSWSWTGPNGYTSTSRQINNIPLSVGTDIYVATYTNTSGAQSTQAFTITVVGTVATPTFNPAPGTYTAAQSVTISDTTPGAVIYYTTNGTTPTTSSSVYSAAIKVSATTTIEAIAVASGYNNSAVATGVYTINGTPIVPYIQVNNGSWQQTASATVTAGSTVNFGPQPLNGGSWSWTGPNGYTSTSRQINSIPLSVGSNVYVATYTNTSGAQSNLAFTITVTAGWTQIGGTAISLAAGSDGTLLIINNQQYVYQYVSGKWNNLNVQAKQLAIINQNNILGIDLNNNLYEYANGNTTKLASGIATVAAGSDGTIVVTTPNQNIYIYQSGKFNQLPGQAKQLAVGNKNSIWAIGTDNNVYQLTGNNWNKVGTNVDSLAAASDGTVIAASISGQTVWQYVSPNNWTSITGNMKALAAVKSNSYFGIGTDNNVYSYGSH
jgi:hypothetical protein